MADELKECARVVESSGITFKSMVFLGGTNDNYKALKEMGHTNYRIDSVWDTFYAEKDRFGL